ncbi:surface-adhesin E family protein [uncultured Salinicola sp.]|uniref:surface-adhesin E family protein n=1 Tax=uncultured Salinicola sp. TaxID=1193542 RepID=UPI00345D69FC
MGRILLFIALALSFSSAARAQNQGREIRYASTSDGSVYYVIQDSIQNSYNDIKVWVRVDQSKNHSVKDHYRLVRWSVSCSDRELHLLNWIIYDHRGGVLDSDSISPNNVDPVAVAPGTVSDSLFRFVCKSD